MPVTPRESLLQRRSAAAAERKTLEVEMAAVGSGLSVEAALKTPSSPAVPSPHLGAPSPGAAVARLQQQRASSGEERGGGEGEESAEAMSREGLVELCDELVSSSMSPRTWERIKHPAGDDEAPSAGDDVGVRPVPWKQTVPTQD